MIVAVSASPWGRSARPAIWMMSITDSFGAAEQDRVDGGHVDALAQAAGVGDHSPAALGRVPQPVQHQFPLGAGHPAVHVPGRDRAVWPVLRRQQPQRGGQGAGELAGLADAGQERQRPPEPEPGGGHRQRGLRGGHPQRHPALGDQLAAVLAVEQLADLGVGDRGDHQPVALQPALGDPPAERVGVGDRAEDLLVVHRGDQQRPRRPRPRCRSGGWPSCTGGAVPA